MSDAIAFVVRDVEKRYGSATVLENATVTIHDDQKIGVIGRNGAGKSTLCRLMLQQEEPDRGEILRTDGLRVGYLEQARSVHAGGDRRRSSSSATPVARDGAARNSPRSSASDPPTSRRAWARCPAATARASS